MPVIEDHTVYPSGLGICARHAGDRRQWRPVVLLIIGSARNYPGPGGVVGMAEKVEELLAQARALLPRRPSPAEAFAAQAKGRC
jgi:hypothetical protein